MGMYLGGSNGGNKGGGGEPKVNKCAKRPRTSRSKAVPTAPMNGWIQPRMQNTFSPAPLDPHGRANVSGLY